MLNGNQHDTNGNIFRGAFNPDGPTNVAVLHHYMTKSFEEYKEKRVQRTESVRNEATPSIHKGVIIQEGKSDDGYKGKLDSNRITTSVSS